MSNSHGKMNYKQSTENLDINKINQESKNINQESKKDNASAQHKDNNLANSEALIPKSQAVEEVRKASRQFAMLYFNFTKTLVDNFGDEKAKELIQETIFNLGIERSNILREKANEKGLDTTIENMRHVSDIPFLGWEKCRGKYHCPYGEQWLSYYKEHPWFKAYAPFYCDVIDTTNAENFTRTTSHKITSNVVSGGESCERVYYPSESVKGGDYTYGTYKKSEKV